MIALDTNVVVRYLVKDDAGQSEQAFRLIASQSVYVTLTLLMETEWVLRKTYGYSREQISGALAHVAALEQVTLENPMSVRLALDLYGSGFDFADAVHLVLAKSASGFATFDKALVRKAKKMTGLVPVYTPQQLAAAGEQI